ncbi:MAG: hypothetical protein AAB116_25200, partial [Candidatus Poribacteria bacterium]
MKKVMITIVLLAFVILTIPGCVKNSPEPIIKADVRANAIDVTGDKIIDDNDIFNLYDLSDQIYNDKVVPYMEKAGINDKRELYTPEATAKARTKLTVVEYEAFIKSAEEWNKVNAQLEATIAKIADKIVETEKPPPGSGKVAVCHVWGPIELYDGTVIKYAGILLPVGGTDNKFSRIVAGFSKGLLEGR